MIISWKNDKHFSPVIFFNETLNLVDSIKFVGININSKMDWSDHIIKVAKWAEQMLGIMVKSQKCLPSNALSSTKPE